MTGLSNYSAFNTLNYHTGQTAMPTLPAVWLALFTAVGTDAGTGFTEVSTSGTAYARVQVAGTVAATASFTTGVSAITMTTNPGWVVPGMSVYDTTNGFFIGTVLTYSGTALTLTANAAHASSGSTDNLTFSAFPQATGTAPASTTNGSVVAFAAATGAGFGTVIAFGLYDAVTAGNLLAWDFLGNFAWLPFEIPTASSTITAKAHGYASNDPIVFTAEYSTAPSALPTMSTGTMTGYTVNFVASPATDTFTCDTTSGPVTPIVTTSSGSGMVRKIVQQSIPNGVTASFAASTLTITAA